MGWIKAGVNVVCAGCDEQMEEGEDVKVVGRETLCEGCAEDQEEFDGDEEDYQIDGVGFADPGGESSLRAETESNPRNLPCGDCEEPDRLTPADVRAGLRCDACANQEERGY